jgi:hypothetical protein
MAPSGQWTRIFATWPWHRSQCRVPVLRGRPRFFCDSRASTVAGGVPRRTGLLIVVEDACSDGAVVVQIRQVLADSLLGSEGSGVGGGECD